MNTEALTRDRQLAAYLVFHTDGDSHWGAVLVVNADGVPEEFLYTGPILPTPAQAILYGPTLQPVVKLRKLALPLVASLGAVPTCVLGSDDLPPIPDQTTGILQQGEVRWRAAPSDEAETLVAALSETGVTEPLARAEAALKYVVDHERSRSTTAHPASPSAA